jgi:hypothetical protein
VAVASVCLSTLMVRRPVPFCVRRGKKKCVCWSIGPLVADCASTYFPLSLFLPIFAQSQAASLSREREGCARGLSLASKRARQVLRASRPLVRSVGRSVSRPLSLLTFTFDQRCWSAAAFPPSSFHLPEQSRRTLQGGGNMWWQDITVSLH